MAADADTEGDEDKDEAEVVLLRLVVLVLLLRRWWCAALARLGLGPGEAAAAGVREVDEAEDATEEAGGVVVAAPDSVSFSLEEGRDRLEVLPDAESDERGAMLDLSHTPPTHKRGVSSQTVICCSTTPLTFAATEGRVDQVLLQTSRAECSPLRRWPVVCRLWP